MTRIVQSIEKLFMIAVTMKYPDIFLFSYGNREDNNLRKPRIHSCLITLDQTFTFTPSLDNAAMLTYFACI